MTTYIDAETMRHRVTSEWTAARVNGFHHYPDDECGCLRVLLEQYLAGEGTFAEFPKRPGKEAGDGS